MVTTGNGRSGCPYFTMALFDYAYFPLTFTYLKLNTMTAIPGVTITRNAKGKLTHINIDLRKHQEAIPVLKEMGLLPETELILMLRIR